jgi:hypothetical protein
MDTIENQENEKKKKLYIAITLIGLMAFIIIGGADYYLANQQVNTQLETNKCYECLVWSCTNVTHGCQGFNCIEQQFIDCDKANLTTKIYSEVPFPNAKFADGTG